GGGAEALAAHRVGALALFDGQFQPSAGGGGAAERVAVALQVQCFEQPLAIVEVGGEGGAFIAAFGDLHQPARLLSDRAIGDPVVGRPVPGRGAVTADAVAARLAGEHAHGAVPTP